MLAIKYISTSKEILELWLHIRIFLSSNKIQLLQKQEKQQLKTTLLKFKSKARLQNFILYFMSSQKIWEICTFL